MPFGLTMENANDVPDSESSEPGEGTRERADPEPWSEYTSNASSVIGRRYFSSISRSTPSTSSATWRMRFNGVSPLCWGNDAGLLRGDNDGDWKLSGGGQ